MWSYMKFGPVVQEKMSYKEKVYGQRIRAWKTDAGRRTKIDHSTSFLVFGSEVG